MVSLFSKTYGYLSRPEADVLSRGRGSDAPYRIHNQTGHPISVWTDTASTSDSSEEDHSLQIADGEEVPWRFQNIQNSRSVIQAFSVLKSI